MSIESTPNHLRFTELNIESYCGIDKTDAIVLLFPQDANVMEVKGDQATKKTSTLNCLKALLGAEEVSNAINNIDKEKKAQLKIITNEGDEVICRITKSSFTVTKIDKEGTRSTITSPKAFLRKLIGPIGLSPMDLKDKPGKEQITWLKEMFSFTDEHKKIEQQLQSGHKEAYNTRRDINRDIKRLKTFLQSTPYYSWDEENKCFVPTSQCEIIKAKAGEGFEEKQKAINEKHKKLMADKSNLDTYRARVENHASAIKANVKRIEDLELEIECLKTENETMAEKIFTGNQYIKEIASCEKELPLINNEMQELLTLKNEYTGFQSINKNFKEYTDLEDQIISLNSKLDEYLIQQKELIKIITPEIEGLEVCISSNIDEPGADNREGIFYNKKSMQELSESELVSLYINIKKALKAKVDIIENISSLGSDAIKAINQFIEDGGTVFYSIMDREEKKLQVSFFQNVK